ncbi:hypothetical protein Pcinc_042700 [Petrolisthes cinctipes]|uniref:Uncharacterized protein n=1 Tax=Petrolisthes cinctipes TaxID=88211 RepID=A0AAE1EGR9_PETCI|nr:hypothetical protein Pcinc_042700 [Petrolisthes cinctipes]
MGGYLCKRGICSTSALEARPNPPLRGLGLEFGAWEGVEGAEIEKEERENRDGILEIGRERKGREEKEIRDIIEERIYRGETQNLD